MLAGEVLRERLRLEVQLPLREKCVDLGVTAEPRLVGCIHHRDLVVHLAEFVHVDWVLCAKPVDPLPEWGDDVPVVLEGGPEVGVGAKVRQSRLRLGRHFIPELNDIVGSFEPGRQRYDQTCLVRPTVGGGGGILTLLADPLAGIEVAVLLLGSEARAR